MLIDCRPMAQQQLINFTEKNAHVYSLPLKEMKQLSKDQILDICKIKEEEHQKSKEYADRKLISLVYVFCRRGRASKEAVVYLNEIGLQNSVDIAGGLKDYQSEIDDSIPTLI